MVFRNDFQRNGRPFLSPGMWSLEWKTEKGARRDGQAAGGQRGLGVGALGVWGVKTRSSGEGHGEVEGSGSP